MKSQAEFTQDQSINNFNAERANELTSTLGLSKSTKDMNDRI